MAVEIPVVIDIDKAFEDAAKRVGRAIKPLQDYVDSETLNIRLKIDENSKKSLASILKNASLSSKQLNTALADVERQIQRIAAKKNSFNFDTGLTDKESRLIQAYTILQRKITGVGNTSTATQKIISINITKVKAEIDKLSAKLKTADKDSARFKNLNNKLIQAKQNLRGLNDELKRMRGQDSLAGLENSLTRSNSKLVTLIKNSVRLLAIHSATRFIRNVREVTSEFELQRVALGGIIQDTERANQLFRQIKAAAIESPFQIKELVSYTKQLSAYRIETDNLFDVTQKLADVSAGLGVDMGRLILAYGQVRAASVLRGQELRQFTEAGIPLVEELAKKFSVLNGRLTSTGEVFDLISKRAVPFEMVAEIFDDMTERGGIFYKMQEKQAETLAGQWSNLKDAVSIMYDEIGNTTVVHRAMEALISDARNLMSNWRQVGVIITSLVGSFASLKVATLFVKKLTVDAALAEKSTLALARAQSLEARASGRANIVRLASIASLKQYAKWMSRAATAQTVFGRSAAKLLAGFLGGGWITAVIAGLGLLIGRFISARQEAERLNKELEKISTEGSMSINRSVSNFQRLANAAVEAADGSDEQNKALKELERTYGDIIPSQDLQIKKLRALKGDYESLTSAIEQKINMQIREQKINATTDAYAGKITKTKKGAKKLLQQYGLDKEQINSVLEELQKEINEGLINAESTLAEKEDAFERIIKNLTGIVVDFGNGFRDYEGIWHQVGDTHDKALKSLLAVSDVYVSLGKETDAIEKEMTSSIGTMGVYANSWDKLQKKIKEVTVSEQDFGKEYTFTYKKEKIRREVDVLATAIEDAFKETGIDISEAFSKKGLINFKILNEAAESSQSWGLSGYIKKIQGVYESLVPTDKMVGVVERKFQELATSVGLSMDDVQGYLLKGGTDMQTYAKDVKTYLEEAQTHLKNLQAQANDYQAHPFVVEPVSDEALTNANAMVKFFELLTQYVASWAKGSGGGGKSYQSDPFIAQMKERMKFMQDFKKGYEDLSKFMTEENALAKEGGIMEARGMALGISPAEQQKAAKELSSWYESARKEVFEQARRHGATGTIESFLRQEIKDTSNKGKALKEFQQLLQSLFDAQTDLDIDQAKKDFEDALAKLKDDIKRSEEVKNFYRDIFDLTGDENIASNLSLSVYGDAGKDLGERLKDSILGTLQAYNYTEDDDIFKTLTESAKNLDFRDVMKNIDKVPEELRTAVKEAAAAAEKYNSDIAKSYAKLLLKFDEIEQQRVNITAQAAKDIETIEKGLDLELKGIRENAAIEDKEAAEKAARERAEAAKAGIISERDLGLKRLDREYRMFFNSVGVISNHAARKVARTQKEMITEQFNAGQKTLAQYKREIREIDEQLRKYENNRGILVTYLTGGTDAAIDKLSEFSDGLVAIADSAFNKKNGSWLIEEDEKEYIDKLGKIFGGKIFGVAGRKNILEQLIKMNEGDPKKIQEALEGAAEAIKEMGANMSQGIGWANFWVSLFGNAIKGLDELAEHSRNASGEVAEGWNDAANIFLKFGTFGLSKSSDAWDRLTALNEKAMSGFEKFKSGDFFGAIVDNIQGWMEVFGTSTKAIDRQIKEQSDFVDELKYQYDRLGVAIEEAFGSDYIYNFQKQQEILQAQAEAYRKQAELEREKGKKADEETAQGYEKSAREIEDQIKDMQGQLAEFFTGTDLTSAARDFAQAWIDAYKEFGSTTDAMKEKFDEMIENMVVNSLAAKLIQSILDPLFKQIDAAAQDDDLTAQEMGAIAAQVPGLMDQINNSMGTLMGQLTSAGINLRQQAGQFTGISRDIAGASEESILGLSAGVNTANFYMSHLPAIAENVAALRAYIVGDAAATVRTTASEGPTYEDQMLGYAANLPMMRDDMYAIRSLLEKVIKPVGTAYYVSVR